MVSLKRRSIEKHKRVSSSSHPLKRQQVRRTPVVLANKPEIAKRIKLSRFLSTLRLPSLSKHKVNDASSELRSYCDVNRRIIRVTELKFESVNKPPIIIHGPSLVDVLPYDENIRGMAGTNLQLQSVFEPAAQGDTLFLQENERPAAVHRGSDRFERADNQASQNETAVADGSFDSWVEVSEPGSRPAVRVLVGLISGIPSPSLSEASQTLLPQDCLDDRSPSFSPSLSEEDITTSSFNEQSFIRMAEADLGW
ncbi:hypothetical protein BC835DRAFT_1021308 [Cytidiella melzeri]|nr:hypothetical protein BC835DRAFT_1021308 [Cytidiella melzeri]